MEDTIVDYFIQVMKLAQFLQAGCSVKILLADVHGFLDNLKAPIGLVELRAKYYKRSVTALLNAVNVPTDKLEFVYGSSYQMSPVGLTLFARIILIMGGSDLLGLEICYGFLSSRVSCYDSWYVGSPAVAVVALVDDCRCQKGRCGSGEAG